MVKPGHKQTIVLNKDFNLLTSGSGCVKNSFEACHETTVPDSFAQGPCNLSENSPSLKVIFSYSLSLCVSTISQLLRNVVILEPIPKEPNEVPSYVPSSLYFPDVFKTLKAASRIVFPSSLNELGIKP